MLDADEVIRQLSAADPGVDDRFWASRRRALALLAQGPAAFRRDNYRPGHITSSAIVLSDDRSHVLLIRHRRLDRWLQPGGHLEPGDASLVAAALREVKEETGLEAGAEGTYLVNVDVHEIPAGRGEPAHLHHDLVWRFSASMGVLRGEEQGAWVPLSRLDEYRPDESLRASIRNALTMG